MNDSNNDNDDNNNESAKSLFMSLGGGTKRSLTDAAGEGATPKAKAKAKAKGNAKAKASADQDLLPSPKSSKGDEVAAFLPYLEKGLNTLNKSLRISTMCLAIHPQPWWRLLI